MAAAEVERNFETRWIESTGKHADPKCGSDCEECKAIYEAFKMRAPRGNPPHQPRAWIIAYPRQHEKYFFQELGPLMTDDTDDEQALRELVERMKQLGRGKDADGETELPNSSHKFKKSVRKPCLGYCHWRENNKFICIDYCSDDNLKVQMKMVHSSNKGPFMNEYPTASGVNQSRFNINSESDMTPEYIMGELAKIHNN